MRTNSQGSLGGTVVEVKPTGGKLYWAEASNGGTVTTWIQFFDLAAADVVLGTTAPKISLAVPKGASPTDTGIMDKDWAKDITFENAISVAATTAPANGTGAAVALRANFGFQ